jgi:hypothetical protein
MANARSNQPGGAGHPKKPPAWLDGTLLYIIKSFAIKSDLSDGRRLKRIGRTLEFFDVHLRGAPREALYRAPFVSAAHFETK